MLRMQNMMTVFGALAAGIAVLAGAVGAHVLHLEPGSARVHTYDTAVIYLLVHGVVVCLGGLVRVARPRLWCLARGLMVFGMLLFSGGIFVYVGAGFDKPLPIIPMGGMSLMGGWLVAALAVCRQSVRDAGFHTARLTEKEED
jgi:uncharacterized membrane protein YgdD (TMEM256/DUF423 family)